MCITLWHHVLNTDNAFDDIIDVGEIALHLAIVEDLDGHAGQYRLGEQEQGHIGPAPGAVHGEEAQAGHGVAAQVVEGVADHLAGLLAGRVQAHRVVHAVVLGKRHHRVAALHAAAAGIHQVLHTVVAAAFEHVHEADDVAVDVGVRVLQRIAHAGLRRQMDDDIDVGGLVFGVMD